ncbi:hypothetical protein C8F01DRAFT_1028188 [Mycena amicta]|nr:hypothetical protein C8F01DRAFT_1028188 [Mycena amicta]
MSSTPPEEVFPPLTPVNMADDEETPHAAQLSVAGAQSDNNAPSSHATDPASPTHRSERATSIPPSLPNAPTLHRISTHDSEGQYLDIDELRKTVAAELSGSWVVEDEGEGGMPERPLHVRIVDLLDKKYPFLDEQVTAWLAGYDGYDGDEERWTEIPAEPSVESDLYQPLTGIFQDIVRDMKNDKSTELGRTGEPLKMRDVVLTANTKFQHNRSDGILKSCPDFGVFGSGPCANAELGIPAKRGYADLHTPVEAKKELIKLTQLIREQLAMYAREVLVQQPNRNFVRIPLITKDTLRVVHFDREGPHASVPFNYHTQAGAVLFVKLMWLFSSLNEEDLGYDTSIHWGPDGKRYMIVNAPSVWNAIKGEWEGGKAFELRIVGKDPITPIFFRRTIRSRGTKCWLVADPDTSSTAIWYVKDYWMAEGRPAESQLLKAVRGLSGVAEIYLWQDKLATVYEQRGRSAVSKAEPIYPTWGRKPIQPLGNRSLMRIVLKRYAGDLSKAKSATQLLLATRDAVRGHRAAFQKKVLHRDISFNNILLTFECYELKYSETLPDPTTPYGVLIDFDMAEFAEAVACGDAKTGTRAFQSVKILLQNGCLGAHDIMDDLESMFYVLCYVCYCHDGSGELLPDLPEPIVHWTTITNASILGTNKLSFMQNGLVPGFKRFSGPESKVMRRLLNRLQKFFGRRIDSVVKTLRLSAGAAEAVNNGTGEVDDGEYDEEDVDSDDGIQDLRVAAYSSEDAERDYSGFLDIIETTIDKLKALPLDPQPADPTRTPPAKRRHTDDSDGVAGSALDSESPRTKKQRAHEANQRPIPPPDFLRSPSPPPAQSRLREHPAPVERYVPSPIKRRGRAGKEPADMEVDLKDGDDNAETWDDDNDEDYKGR